MAPGERAPRCASINFDRLPRVTVDINPVPIFRQGGTAVPCKRGATGASRQSCATRTTARFWVGGPGTLWKLTSEETDDLMRCSRITRAQVTPMHLHDVDEALYVIEGEIFGQRQEGEEHVVGRVHVRFGVLMPSS